LIRVFLLLFLISCGKSPFLDDPTLDTRQVQAQSQKEKIFFKSENLDLHFYFKTPIVIGEEVTLIILFTNQEGILSSSDLDLNLKLWMPNMGHGSFPTSIHKITDGVYEVREIFFTMPGRWDLHFQLVDTSGKVKEEVLWGMDL
tara:strand:+ start:583 stop:1014 length:432 start_codon:yes stop_codon:yes gene_type:complete